MKKLISIISVLSLALSGCLKDTPPNDFGKIFPVLEMPYSGLEYFANASIVTAGATDPIVIPFTVNLASVNTLSSDITYTVALDDAKRTAYNATPSNPIVDYIPLPTALYTISRTSGTIKAGKRLDTLYLTITDPTLIDPSKDFMIPISLKTVSNGVTISGNFSTQYFHIIGNPLAGNYRWDFYRWQGADTTIPPPQGFTGATAVILPITPTSVMTPESYTNTFIDPTGGIVLSFTNTAGILTNFGASLNANTLAGIPAGGFLLLDGPSVVNVTVVGSPATNYIGTRIRTFIRYQNSSGGIRSLINNFVKIP